jgi:hypothetical protein
VPWEDLQRVSGKQFVKVIVMVLLDKLGSYLCLEEREGKRERQNFVSKFRLETKAEIKTVTVVHTCPPRYTGSWSR